MSAASEKWLDPTGPLGELAKELGIELKELHLNEWPDELNYTKTDLPTEAVVPQEQAAWQQKRSSLDGIFRKLLDKYGQALTLKLKIGQLSLFTLSAGYQINELDNLHDKAQGSQSLILELRIDKGALIAHWGFSSNIYTDLKLFLFSEALVRALSVPLDKLTDEHRGVLRGFRKDRKVVLLVPGHEIELSGDFLSVLGGSAMSRLGASLSKGQLSTTKVSYFREQAKMALKWANFKSMSLTPLHLNVKWELPKNGSGGGPEANDAVAGAIYAQLLACSLLYMASHAARRDDDDEKAEGDAGAEAQPQDALWLATFAADKYLTKFDVGEADKLCEALRTGDPESPWATSRMIADVAAWAYSGERDVKDRLSVLQSVVANSLQESNAAVNCRELVRQAASVKKRVEWGWDSFVNKRLEKYFSQVKDLEDIVESTARSYNEQVQALSKTLIDNMLAAVGVVVGSFIAAIFKIPFGVNVFRVSTSVYAVYLAVFPMTVGLLSAWQRYKDSQSNFKKRKADFAKRLTPEEIEEIVGDNVSGRERWFKWWFACTALAYVVVLSLVITAIIRVPNLIRNWSDEFELAGVSYGVATGENVQVIVRGQNFDKDKEVVAEIGPEKFSNTDGQTLKVHGSTVLTLSVRRRAIASLGAEQRRVTVRQGAAASQQLDLPQGLPTITKPVFEKWTRAGAELAATGSGFDSISSLTYGGSPLEFKLADGGKRLLLPAFKRQKGVESFEVTLYNDEKLPVPLPPEQLKKSP